MSCKLCWGFDEWMNIKWVTWSIGESSVNERSKHLIINEWMDESVNKQ